MKGERVEDGDEMRVNTAEGAQRNEELGETSSSSHIPFFLMDSDIQKVFRFIEL